MLSNPVSIAEDATMAKKLLDRLTSSKGRNSRTLLKDPAIATPPSWHLWLPPHFNTALDLKFIQKQQVKDKVIIRQWKEWAQGSNFCFNESSIIYDRDVSHLETWGDKLRAIKFYLVLGATKPARRDTTGSAETTSCQRDPGIVNYSMYEPSLEHGSRLVAQEVLTQDEFVHFAITGSPC